MGNKKKQKQNKNTFTLSFELHDDGSLHMYRDKLTEENKNKLVGLLFGLVSGALDEKIIIELQEHYEADESEYIDYVIEELTHYITQYGEQLINSTLMEEDTPIMTSLDTFGQTKQP